MANYVQRMRFSSNLHQILLISNDWGPGWLNKPITNTTCVRARLCELQKGCTRLAAASDKVYQLVAHGRWFSPGTPASSTTKTGRHDIAEKLLKVALSIKNQSINQSNDWKAKTINFNDDIYII